MITKKMMSDKDQSTREICRLINSPSLTAQMSNSPLVWFLLYDCDGRPYKGASADAVSLPLDSMIIHFRDAVKVKYDQPGFLKEIPSGLLLVYKNKDAFAEKVNHDSSNDSKSR
jgi:hypothetical protein